MPESVPGAQSLLCADILISQRALATIEDLVEPEAAGDLVLKGFVRPVTAYRILRLRA